MRMQRAKTWVEVSASALSHNLLALRTRLKSGVKLMAVVKANAYGHGLRETAQIAASAGAEWFGVDSIDEALALREAGLSLPILVLGYTVQDRLEDAVTNRIDLVVYNKETIDALETIGARAGEKASVHVKIETGTSRQGLNGEEAVKFVRDIRAKKWVTLAGCSTHYANIEDTTDHTFAHEQLKRFEEVTKWIASDSGRVPIRHTACSAAIVLFPETHFDLVRAGISLYGHWSSPQTRVSANGAGSSMEFQPALTWKTRVAQVKRLPKGATVSYGLTETLRRDSVVAILPVGYYDGFDRKLSSVGEALIRGNRAKLLGRVCMNMTVFDVTDIPNIAPGDEAVLIGRQGNETIAAEDLAAKCGTVQYEILARINPLLPRIIVK